MNVTLNLLEGHNAKYTADGFQVEATAFVDNVPGTGIQKLKNACEAGGLPELGDSFSNELSNCILEEMAPEMVDLDKVKIRLIYREHEEPEGAATRIQISTSLTEKSTNLNRDGGLITTTYNGDIQTGTVNIMIPRTTMSITRVETMWPLMYAKWCVGKTNAAVWDIDPDAALNTWLCTEVAGGSEDRGLTWEVTYGFEYDEDQWQATVVYVDEDSKLPPNDVSEGNGIEKVDVYHEFDFNALMLLAW